MSEHREYCENCGVAIGEPSAFCGNCGAALSAPEPIAATATAAGVPAHSEVAGTGTPPTPTQRGSSQATQTPGTTRTTTSGIDTGAHRREAPPLGGTPPPGAPPTGAPPAGAPIPASEQPSEKSRKWIPFAAIGGGALLVLAMVAALLLALGGSAGKNVKSASATREQALQLLAANGTTTVSRVAPGLFALVTTGKLTTAVPAGWRATAQTAGDATRAEFADPQHAASTLTIVAQKEASGSEHNRAVSARRAVSSKGDAVRSLGSVTFPGGRQAWLLSYSAAGVTHETYFFSACNNNDAMVVDVAATTSLLEHEQASLQAIAASAEPKC